MSLIYVRDFVSYGLILVNVAMFGLLAYYSYHSWRAEGRQGTPCFLMMILSGYWALLYVYVFFSDLGIFPPRGGLWSALWVRPALSFLATLLAFMGMQRKKLDEK